MNLLLCGASSIAGIDNFGDQLLMDIYEEWSREAISPEKITRVSYSGNASRDRIEDQVASADMLVFVGGGYFGEKPFRSSNPLLTYAKKLAWGYRNDDVYGRVFRAAKRRGMPILVSGVEAGPISNPVFRMRVKNLAESAEYVAVRNKESQNFLTGLGAGDINLYPDTATILSRENAGTYLNLAPGSGSGGKNDFHISIHMHELDGTADADRLRAVVDEVRKHVSDRTVSVSYVHDQKKNAQHPQRSADAERAVIEAIPGTKSVEYFDTSRLVDHLMGVDLVITSKLHLGIVSRALDIPVVSFPAHLKTPRFYALLDEGFRCMTLKAFPGAGLPVEIQKEIAQVRGGAPFPKAVRDQTILSKKKFQSALIEASGKLGRETVSNAQH